MTQLSTSELAQIRADVLTLLPDTGYLLTLSMAPDGAGGISETWGTAGTVAYRLDPIRQRESIAGAALTSFNMYQLTLPHDTTVTAEQRFKAADGSQYSILGVDGNKSWAASVRCKVEKL
jgi:SPP1 family predicted phage head-tail adaptor